MMKYHNTGGSGKDWGHLEVKRFSFGPQLTFEARMGGPSFQYTRSDGSPRVDIVLNRDQLVDLHSRLGAFLKEFASTKGEDRLIEGEGF